MVFRLRLWSGLLLLAFVTTHLMNHSLGLVSLEAMEAGRIWFLTWWRSPPGSILLYGALVIHLVLAFPALAGLPSLKVPWKEGLRLILGFSIPFFLLIHILGTRYANEILGVNDLYAYVLIFDFHVNPSSGIRKVLLILAAWIHGCLGLHFWLRLKNGYENWRPFIFSFALLLPTLALAGYWVAGRAVLRLIESPQWLDEISAKINYAAAEEVEFIYQMTDWGLAIFVLLALLALALRPLREVARRRLGLVQVRYPDDRRVTVPKGTTILAASQRGGIAHASVCGGRGRCSTCRIRLLGEDAALSEVDEGERKVLERIKAVPNVRLACQARVVADLAVVPLLPAEQAVELLAGEAQRQSLDQGQEREIAVLFADLRGFTTLSEDKLPFDVVFVLNRYFAAMGNAVEGAGGHVDKFIGDGVMALFGLEESADEACQNALMAARDMALALEQLNESLASDLPQPLRMGIGIHSGAAIVGKMGYGRSTSVTAIGDTVNTASRLETMTKEFGAQLVVSEQVVQAAGTKDQPWRLEEVSVRGRNQPLAVRVAEKAVELKL